MFEKDERDLCATLSEMENRSRIVTNFDQPAALTKMAAWIKQDRRFDNFDAERLSKRVQECLASGAVLDMSDPYLKKGGERRPLDRRTAG